MQAATKRLTGAAAALVLAALGLGAGFSGVNTQPERVSIDRQLGVTGTTYHAFTRTEYLQPRLTPVRAAIAPTFDDGDTNFTTFYVAVADSIRNSLGRFNPTAGGSSWGGADLRGTSWIMPSQTTTPGTGSKMTTAQVQALGGRSLHYELGTHGPDEERLGSVGMDNAAGQVSYAGVTGMSREFLRATLGAYQDSAAAWGIPAFRSHGYANWRMQHGMGDIWEEFGYFQCKGITVPMLQDQSNADISEISAQQRNSDPFFPSVYGYGQPDRYGGMHRIGEPFSPWDVGGRSSWQYNSGNDNGSTDSLKVYTDILCQHAALGVITFHQIVPNGTRGAGSDEGLKIEESEMYDLMYFWASRVSEGLLDVLTFEQLVTRMRGIRDGNLFNTRNFMRLADSRVSSRLAASIHEPLMFMPVIGANSGMYGSSLDTLGVPQTGTAGSYGVASSTGNILIQQGNTTNTDGLDLTIVTTGSDAKYVYLAVQAAGTVEATPFNWDAGQWFLGCKAGQFTEIWEDNVNSGINSYQSMPDVIGWRTAPTFYSFKVENQRVRPQFTFWYSDTTAATGTGAAAADSATGSLLLVTEGTAVQALTSPMAQFFRRGSGELPMYSMFDRSGSWDLMRSSFGNWYNPTLAGNANEAVLDNVQLVESGATIRNWLYMIPVNPRTDYVQVHLSLERNSTSLSSNLSFAILNVEAYPIR
jgi:hypothetical protein